jgi:hypothetical protein
MKTFYPGDTIQVESKEQLPGYPNAWHGWELIEPVSELAPVPKPKKDYMGVGECLPQAKLKAIQVTGKNWKVVIETPGLNYTAPDGVVLPVGTKVSRGFVREDRAKAWAETGYDAASE